MNEYFKTYSAPNNPQNNILCMKCGFISEDDEYPPYMYMLNSD